jgi:hypothetical protein
VQLCCGEHVPQWFWNHVGCFAAAPNLPHPLPRKAHDNPTHVVLLSSPLPPPLPYAHAASHCLLAFSLCSCDIFCCPPPRALLLSRRRRGSIRWVFLCILQSISLTGCGMGLATANAAGDRGRSSVPTWLKTQLHLASTNHAVRPIHVGIVCSKHTCFVPSLPHCHHLIVRADAARLPASLHFRPPRLILKFPRMLCSITSWLFSHPAPLTAFTLRGIRLVLCKGSTAAGEMLQG